MLRGFPCPLAIAGYTRRLRKMSCVLPPPLALRSRAAVASSLAAHPLPLVEAADRLSVPRSAERCVGFRPQDTARCGSLAWGDRARFTFARGGRKLPCCSPAPARRSFPVGGGIDDW